MVWKVEMEVGDHIRSWSDQQIKMGFDDVDISIEIKDRKCNMVLEGERSSTLAQVPLGTIIAPGGSGKK